MDIGNQYSQTYKKDITIEYLKKYPNASTMAIARMMAKDYPLDWSSAESARGIVRKYRGEHPDSAMTIVSKRTEEVKKQFMSKKFELPESDYTKIEPFIIPKGQNNILILSDIHLPYQDNKALELAINYGLEKKVNAVYLNGDTLDMYQASRYTKDRRLRDLAGELQMCRDFLKSLQDSFNCPIYFKIGNHCERWENFLMLKAPELLGIDDFKLEQILRLREFGTTLIKSKQIAYAGKLAIMHGHEFGQSIFSPVNPARGLYMRGKESVIAGHNHQTSEHTEKSLSGDVVTTWSMGCLCGLSPEYMPYNKWNHGFAHLIVNKDGTYKMNNIRIIDYKIV